jgi:uncharacterized protein YprB with RNaseH-like and TPR domain
MIVRENSIKVKTTSLNNVLELNNNNSIYNDALFFDLEHYVYKKPICIGVFGCCYYDKLSKELKVTQYMIENRLEASEILSLAENYFKKMYEDYRKRYIVTFSGNNDFTVINYLFNKHRINFNFDDYFTKIDIQKEYEKITGICTGLKTLEKKFDIFRDNEPISGSNLAKTFSKVMKDDEYVLRMPQEKIQKILIYNEQDVINLYHIFVNWKNHVSTSSTEISADEC